MQGATHLRHCARALPYRWPPMPMMGTQAARHTQWQAMLHTPLGAWCNIQAPSTCTQTPHQSTADFLSTGEAPSSQRTEHTPETLPQGLMTDALELQMPLFGQSFAACGPWLCSICIAHTAAQAWCMYLWLHAHIPVMLHVSMLAPHRTAPPSWIYSFE
jgi:hypothetical protein